MNRALALLLLLALPGLSGCVALAVPVAAGAMMGRGIDRPPHDGAKPPAAGRADAAAEESQAANAADAQVALLSSAEVVGVVPYTEVPAPSGVGTQDDPAYSQLFAKVTTIAQRDPFSQEKRKSAILADPGTLKPDRAECAFAQTAVLVDLDPADSEAPLAEDVVTSRQLARVLATLRAQEVAVLWLSRHTAVRAGAVRRALLRSGLDPSGADELYLVRYEDETKATRRADAAGDFCIVAILGDQKRDFDELFAFLKDPDAAFALDPLIGEAWFLAPAPLTSLSQSEQGSQDD